jgi:hypothetical protein
MRLTLRTLLAYLDDTLAPAEAKLIGQKVAESDTAQELIARIREVTRRRRITTPTGSSLGAKVDPNTIAEYLDNVLPAEALAEVEQLALASDVHLADIAACHQILTLVLGEQATVPPLAYKRMYGLVKPPESDPAHEPPLRRDHEVAPVEGKEVDETLRLGLPILRTGGWGNRLILLGGVTAALLLLSLAIWQLLPPLTSHDNSGGDNVAQAGTGTTGKVSTGVQTKKDASGKEKKDTATKTPTAKDKKEIDPNDKKEILPKDKKEIDPKDKMEFDDTPPPPDPTVKEIGDYESPPVGSNSVLLQLLPAKKPPAKSKWVRLERGKEVPRIISNAPLMSLPGYRSVVKLDTGLRLTLWGNLPEFWPVPPTQESLVVLHPSTQVALDVTLKRGRIAVTNPTDKPLKMRLRFHNPGEPDKGEVWEVVLDKDSEVFFNRSGVFFDGEPFYPNSKSTNRVGPMGVMLFVVTSGQVSLKASDGHKYDKLVAPPDGPLIVWTSKDGLLDPPQKLKSTPPWTSTAPPPLPNVDAKLRAAVNKALSDLSVDLAAKDIDKVLLKTLEKPGDLQKRRLAVRCAGAIDDFERVIDTFKDKDKEVRWTAIETLSVWITHERDNDYRLFEALQLTHGPFESKTIMELLHGFSREQFGDPATYKQLIDYLTDKHIAIREIAYWHLWHMVPAGQGIPYNATDNETLLRRAARDWQDLIPPGKLPPPPKMQG